MRKRGLKGGGRSQPRASEFRLAEPVAALSVATDHVRGQPPGRACRRSSSSCTTRGSRRAAASSSAPNFDENFLNLAPAAHVEGLYSCLDYYRNVDDAFSTALLDRYNTRFPGDAMFTAGSACSGMYRGLKLWEAAVQEAGSLDQDAVVSALDHASIAEGPGGPAEMVPGQHHVRMNMYIAQPHDGDFQVVKSLGAIDPKEEPRRIAGSGRVPAASR